MMLNYNSLWWNDCINNYGHAIIDDYGNLINIAGSYYFDIQNINSPVPDGIMRVNYHGRRYYFYNTFPIYEEIHQFVHNQITNPDKNISLLRYFESIKHSQQYGMFGNFPDFRNVNFETDDLIPLLSSSLLTNNYRSME